MKMAFWRGSMMNATEYKSYHESYMANNEGTTAVHVFLSIFFTVLCTLNSALKGRQPIINEYFTIVLPLILAHTVLAKHILALNVLILIYTIYEHKFYLHLQYIFTVCCLRNSQKSRDVLLLEHQFKSKKDSIINSFKEKNLFRSTQIQSISCLRGLTYLITVYAILAVDFKAFRKELRKTEQYGYSLMDTGVGLFTLMSGFVHKSLQNHSLKQIFKSNLKFILVLVSLGTARFWTVKALNYHEHVTEYGVHWNFFFTVAMCKCTSTVLLYISNQPFLLSLLTLTMHEYILSSEIDTWVFSDAPRTDLISANREGIFSSLGYSSLYLYAVHVKQLLNDKTMERYKILMMLVIHTAILWLISGLFNMVRPISRTLANSAYCVYICAVILTILSVLYFFEATKQDKEPYFETPVILTAINQNGLIYFLVANLFTGVVNLSMQTLFVPTMYAIIILNVYMSATLALMLYLRDKGIKI